MQPVLIIGALKPEDAINGLITVLFLLLLITLNYTVCPLVIFNHPDMENENCFGTEAGKEKKKKYGPKISPHYRDPWGGKRAKCGERVRLTDPILQLKKKKRKQKRSSQRRVSHL